MDTKFDSTAAHRLLKQMETYCTSIQYEYRALSKLVNDFSTWDDKQAVAFRANMMGIAEDLDIILRSESDYMNTFLHRIQELEE